LQGAVGFGFINMKTCTKCLEQLNKSCFYAKKDGRDGLYSQCKDCIKEKQRHWRENNLERKKELDREYAKNNRDKRNEANRRYRIKHAEKIKKKYKQNKSKHLQSKREYYLKNRDRLLQKALQYQSQTKDKRNARQRLRSLTDPKFRIGCAMGKALSKALAGKKAGQKWETLVGYTVTDLMAHLEPQFTPEMTWDNYGSYWHLDHLVPQYYFEYDSYDHPHFRACWSLDNLQPLEAEKNLRKNRHVIQL
jgi:hypothetical protein